ncbi:MAG: squalene synthase HpnC [Candidatus Electryoneaceae bacterium]|nr:squalene synthase HpnC [Candidatus Electryoneaceae bacterium]
MISSDVNAQLDITDGKIVKAGESLSRSAAQGHYENFSIGAFMLPKRLRQDLFNVYAFCRFADDIADEPDENANPEKALDEYEQLLDNAVQGQTDDPIFAALGSTIRRRNLSLEPFRNLLKAFRLDLVKTRWKDWNDLREYTRYSADPVGRIVLELCDERQPEFFALSDNICTALQLANHWQDIAEDWERGRIYIPKEDMERFGVTESQIAQRRFNDRFRRLMEFEVRRTKELFSKGRPLIKMVGKPLDAQLTLYWQGGTAALDAVERVGYDVLNHPTKIRRAVKFKILTSVLLRWLNPWRIKRV